MTREEIIAILYLSREDYKIVTVWDSLFKCK